MEDLTLEQVWQVLEQVKDPEIPVVSVVELGILREVHVEGRRVHVTITPTFTGCPALQVMQSAIEARLQAAGAEVVEVNVTLTPAWSTEWITPAAREKLKNFGLAPPPHHSGDFELALLDVVTCPYCNSQNTSLRNSFGPTLCRAIFFCNDCRQPFEQFKPL